jgi:hypothetical protein
MVPVVPRVLFSGEVGAMTDVGQAFIKCRGRLRKAEPVNEKEKEPVPPGPSKGSVTDSVTEECVDSGGNGAILNVGESGGPARQTGRETGSWRWTADRDRCLMSESSRNGLGTAQDQPYTQSMYPVNLYMISALITVPRQRDYKLCLIVFICFRRINHMAVNPSAFIL